MIYSRTFSLKNWCCICCICCFFGGGVVHQRWPVKMPNFKCQDVKLHVLSCPTSHVIFAFYPA